MRVKGCSAFSIRNGDEVVPLSLPKSIEITLVGPQPKNTPDPPVVNASIDSQKFELIEVNEPEKDFSTGFIYVDSVTFAENE